MTNSRAKGIRGELEAAKLLESMGAKAHRSAQHCGRWAMEGETGAGDLIHSVDGVHIEVKYASKINLYQALTQAACDAKEGEAPMVLHRCVRVDGKAKRPWIVVLAVEDLPALAKRIVEAGLHVPGAENDQDGSGNHQD